MTAKEFFEQNRGKYFYYECEKVRVVGYGTYSDKRIIISKKNGWEYNEYSMFIGKICTELIEFDKKCQFVDIDRLTQIEQPKIDLCKILEGCEGITLYSPIHGDVVLESINNLNTDPIIVTLSDGDYIDYCKDGRYLAMYNGECMLFPSKENRDWSTFVKPNKIKDGTPVMCFDDGNFIWVLDNFKESSIDGYYKWIVPVSEFDFSDFDSNKSKSII